MIMNKFNLKNLLSSRLTEEELKHVPNSFDTIGSRDKAVAIVEIPEELEMKEKIVAETIMQNNKNVKSVLKKVSERKGEFRSREYELLAGDTNTEVIHKEYGYLLKLDPQKVYFSPREATERQRIANQVKPDETVMLMFAGICAYGIAIGKIRPDIKKIIAIEINPSAVDYMKENIRMNKVSHLIVPVLGDVKDVYRDYLGICDRVIMPLPLGAENFLGIAVKCLKPKGGIIHFYNWGEEPDIFATGLKIIDETFKKLKKKYEVINKYKVLPYAPKKWKVCFDLKVNKC
ncbi:class I SAM-dependent methyltransferase family protein [archaeon]|nr:class I SAM-dependent methyltransferase family protein [archaeon]